MKVYKKPNLKGKRFRCSKNRFNLFSKDFYALYKEKYPNSKLTYKDTKEIILAKNTEIIDLCVSNRDGYSFPRLMGKLICCMYDTRHTGMIRSIEHGKSLQTGIEVINTNFNCNSFIGKICFSFKNKKYYMKNYELWNFLPFRDFKRKLSAKIKNNDYRHFTVIGLESLSMKLRKQKKQYNDEQGNYIQD